MWTTFYVDANGNATRERPFAFPPPNQPFVAEAKAFYDVLGESPSLTVVAQANSSQFHEGTLHDRHMLSSCSFVGVSWGICSGYERSILHVQHSEYY